MLRSRLRLKRGLLMPYMRLAPFIGVTSDGNFPLYSAFSQPVTQCYFDDHRMRLVLFSGKAPFCWSQGLSLGVCHRIKLLVVGSWIETARKSVVPSRTDAWSQFPTISSYSSISTSVLSIVLSVWGSFNGLGYLRILTYCIAEA